MASRSFKHTRSALSASSDLGESNKNRQPIPLPTVTFGRRTSSGRYISYSRDDLDSELGNNDLNGEFSNYTVHIPPTPDNQPMDPSISQKVEEQYVSSSLFTGGFNSVTRAHLMDKVIESETSHPQMAGAKGSSCSIPGCDAKVMSDER
ncbi:Cellulose synthase-like protein d3, partial [Thalictrum thalictroides]